MAERARLVGVTERRSIPATDFEVRADGADALILEGYASVFEHGYDVAGGPMMGGWTEIVDRRAFDATLAKQPDVHLLVNHEGLPLARTKSGTMDLTTDKRGLRVVARLEPSDPDVAKLEPKMRRHDMDEMSFAFRTVRQEWSGDETERRLLEVNINKGDVSVVNFGASDATTVHLRNLVDAVGLLSDLDPAEALAELRGLDNPLEALTAANAALSELIRSFAAPSVRRLSVAEAERLIART